MKVKLVNQQSLTRRLRQCLMLLVMMFAPQAVWAEDYALWIGNVQVSVPDGSSTVSYTSNNHEGIKVGSIMFSPGTNNNPVLQLRGVQTDVSIKSNLGGSLTVQLFGHNQIGSLENNNPAIYSEYGGTLTLTNGDSNDATLFVETMAVTSVIYGFESLTYTGFSVEASGSLYSQELGLNDGNYGVKSATFYTGELYPLWVGGTQLSSANISDIRDDNISDGTMSYDPESNTLTMNNVIADMASDDNCFIESTITDLKVNLLGTSEVTLNYQMYQTDNCFARLKTGTGSLTFETQRAQNLDDEYVFGSLTVNLSSGPSTIIDGSTDKTLVAKGYTISNTFGDETPCWSISDNLTDQVEVWYDGALYDLAVAGVLVTSANASNVLGDAITGSVSYDATTNTLTLDNADLTQYNNNAYQRTITYYGSGNLKIALKGNNKVSRVNHNNDKNVATLSFVKVEGADDCQLELNYPTNEESVLSFFKEVDFGELYTVSDGPITFKPFYGDENSKTLNYLLLDNNSGVTQLLITSAMTYPLWVAGTQVTEANKANVKDDNTNSVSFAYDAVNDVNTLTLHNALLNKAIVSDLSNLTIHLNGMNTIENTSVMPKAIQSINSGAILTFTSEVDQTSSLPDGYLMFGEYVTTPIDGFASYNYDNGLAYGRSDGTRCVGLISYFFIGSDEINSAKLSVIGGLVSFDKETNTLSLKGIGDAGVIRYNQYEDITIEFDGANSTGYIAGTGYGNLYVKIAADAEAPSPELDITGNYDGLGAISGFENCTWEDGLYMNPYTYKEVGGYTVLSGVYFDTETGNFAHPSASVDQIVFSTEQVEATPSIWIGDAQVNDQGVFVNSKSQQVEGASFAVVEGVNVLTLSGAEQTPSIVSSLPNLTIKLSGTNSASQIVSTNPSAELTIVKDDQAESATLNLATELASVISGFADVELSGMYYVCSEMYEYNTTTKKFVNPIDDTEISMLTISSTVAYPLWIAGTQVTGANASNIFNDDYSSASYAGNTLTLKACQNDSEDYDYAIKIGGEENLNIDFVGYNILGNTKTKKFIYANDACTVTFSTDGTMPGEMKCITKNAGDFKTDNVTIDAGDLSMTEETNTATTTIKSSSAAGIYYFGCQSFSSSFGGDYPYGDEEWYFTNAVKNSGNSYLPPIVNSSECTTKMKTSGYETVKSLTFQCLPLSGDAAITVSLKKLEDESVVYATGTLTNGVVTLTPNNIVTYSDVCLVFTSTSNFSFVPLAVQSVIKPDIPFMYCSVSESSQSLGFEYGMGCEVHYAINYVSDDFEDVDDTIWDDNLVPIDGPCTVTAYCVKDGVESDHVKGKYFDSNPSPFRLVCNADPVDLVLAPAIEAEDGISINGIEVANVSCSDGKVSSSTYGSFSGPISLNASEGKTTILNNYFTIHFEVVPPVPTIGLASGTYQSTHAPIEITAAQIANATIKYQWNDGSAYEYEEAIPVQNGTLKAWVELIYDQASGATVSSDEATATYALTYDITFAADKSWATYYATENLAKPAGLTVYTVSNADLTTGVVTVQEINYIPEYQGVLLNRAEGATTNSYTTTAYTGQPADIVSVLKGTPQAASIQEILESLGYVSTATVYVLYNDAFVKATSGTIPANRGLLVFGNLAEAPRLTIEIDGGATGVDTVHGSEVMVNDYYDLSGRKLSGKPSQSGLYIKNGKKVVVNK